MKSHPLFVAFILLLHGLPRYASADATINQDEKQSPLRIVGPVMKEKTAAWLPRELHHTEIDTASLRSFRDRALKQKAMKQRKLVPKPRAAHHGKAPAETKKKFARAGQMLSQTQGIESRQTGQNTSPHRRPRPAQKAHHKKKITRDGNFQTQGTQNRQGVHGPAPRPQQKARKKTVSRENKMSVTREGTLPSQTTDSLQGTQSFPGPGPQPKKRPKTVSREGNLEYQTTDSLQGTQNLQGVHGPPPPPQQQVDRNGHFQRQGTGNLKGTQNAHRRRPNPKERPQDKRIRRRGVNHRGTGTIQNNEGQKHGSRPRPRPSEKKNKIRRRGGTLPTAEGLPITETQTTSDTVRAGGQMNQDTVSLQGTGATSDLHPPTKKGGKKAREKQAGF